MKEAFVMIRLRLEEIIEAKNIINRTQLAVEMDLGRNTLTKLLNKKDIHHITLDSIEKMCKTLDITPNELFFITNDDGSVWKPDTTRSLKKELSIRSGGPNPGK